MLCYVIYYIYICCNSSAVIVCRHNRLPPDPIRNGMNAHIKTVLCDRGLMSLCPLFSVHVRLQLTTNTTFT